MGTEVRRIPEAAALTGADGAEADGGPIGAYLARQRRLRDISLEELEAATRIPVRSLERLEAGSFDDQPDGFARGFVRTVAIALGLDPDDAVNRMRPEPSSLAVSAPPELDGRPLPWLLLAALAGLLVMMLLVTGRLTGGAGEDADPTVLRRDPVRALADAQRAHEVEPATR